jgi:hypothetical protein
MAVLLLSPTRHTSLPAGRKEPDRMDEEEHPKGALAFMLIYLLILAVLWTNAYLKLWGT